MLRTATVIVLGSLTSASMATVVIPSPSNDLLLSSKGGVADINGSTTDGAANYGGLPPANFNDGERDGRYGNQLGVDGFGSIAHTAGGAANQEMGVTLTAPTAIASVILFNRTDCCGGRIDGNGTVPYTLNIFNTAVSTSTPVYTSSQLFTADVNLSATNPLTNQTDAAAGQTLTLPSPVVGNYVQIVQVNNDFMNLAELEAYAPVPEPASLALALPALVGLLARRR